MDKIEKFVEKVEQRTDGHCEAWGWVLRESRALLDLKCDKITVRAWHKGDDRYIPQWVKVFALIPNEEGIITKISFSGEIKESENHPNVKKKRQRETMTNWNISELPIELTYERI